MSKPRPWRIHQATSTGGSWLILDANGEFLAVANGADVAELIFKRVNLHDELVEALDKAYLQIIEFLNEGNFNRLIEFNADYIVDVLTKAKAEAP